MSERPGVMFYFSARSSLKRLSNEQKGLLFEAILEYAENAVVPDFDEDPVLAIAWDFIRPAVDKDGDMYEKKKAQSRYATYCREEKKKHVEPLSFDDWFSSSDIAGYHPISDDNFDHRNYPITVTVPITESIPTTNTLSVTKAIAVGDASCELTQEQAFNMKRNDALRMIGAL